MVVENVEIVDLLKRQTELTRYKKKKINISSKFHRFQLVFIVIITIGFERSIPMGVDDNCHGDMTGKRGRECHRMNNTWLIQEISLVLVVFSWKTLHYLILMMSLMMLSAFSKAI